MLSQQLKHIPIISPLQYLPVKVEKGEEMLKLHSIIATFIVATAIAQPTIASSEFNEEDVMACVPVGEIAKRISELQKLGFEREFVETKLNQELNKGLSVWISPLSKLVFSRQEKSPEKSIKQAIGYCLQTMKAHKKIRHSVYVEA